MLKSDCGLKTFLQVDEEKLPGFGKLLESWFDVHKRFSTGVAPENSWEREYKERSQIGFLSNAAFLSGGIALEEWGAKKKSGYGRFDLWLRLKPSSNERDYHIEAKLDPFDIRNPIEYFDLRVNDTMKSALTDANRLGRNDGKIVAATFLVLRLEDENTGMIDRKIQELLNRLEGRNRQMFGLDAIAAIWLGLDAFKLCRKKREESLKGWKACEVGLMFLASRIAEEKLETPAGTVQPTATQNFPFSVANSLT